MKIVTCMWANILLAILVSLLIESSCSIGTGGLKKNKILLRKNNLGNKFNEKKIDDISKPNEQSEESPTARSEDLPDLPVYFKGWIKYLHYTENGKRKAKAFYKNPEFEEQSKRFSTDEIIKKDDDGFIHIPNEIYFYSILYKDTFNVLASKEGYTHVVDSFELDYIRSVPEEEHFEGGITDFGVFDEGYCFKVNLKMPSEPFIPSAEHPEPLKGVETYWVICLDTQGEKDQLMNVMIKLKLKRQHDLGIYLEVASNGNKKQQGSSESFYEMKQNMKFGPGSVNSPNDGYWVLIQDWTNCTLKCGGGLQYQQLLCVPPKTGGKPCVGDNVRTRPCNQDPCPLPQVLSQALSPGDSISNKADNNTLAPIVKMMPVSKRPQRYDKCYIKESDVLMEKDDEETKNFKIKPKIPIRLVMNDRTLIAYQDDNITSKLASYNLKDSILVRIDGEKKCFIIKNNVRSNLFCQLDSYSGDFIEEWDYDFNLFKYQCRKKRVKSDNVLPEQQKLEKEFQEKVSELKTEIVMEIAEKNKEHVEENEELKLNKKVAQIQTTSLQALEKEVKMEDLLEKEEEAMEDSETKFLENQIDEEKKREECIAKAIKEKELENQMNVAKSKAEKEIKKIQDQTKKQIAMKRLEIKKKIMEMRKKQQRKKSSLKSEIMHIRTVIANKLNKLNKNGNGDLCKNNLTSQERTNYCQQNFADSYVKYDDCMGDTSFCYVCCENEFGDFHVSERDKCYAKCDNTKQ